MMKPGDVRALLPRLRESQYDLVHIQTPFVAHYLGIEIADALGVPGVETYHTFFEEYLFHYVPVLPKSGLRSLSRHFSRKQCNRMNALIVPSFAMLDKLAEYGVMATMHVIPTGIPGAEFATGDGDAFRNLHRIEKNRPTLLFVGYLDRPSALLDCYRAADAFVFASPNETQGLCRWGRSLGVPVISTGVMGTRDIVGPQRGALVPEDNEPDFARSVVKLMSDPALRARLGAEGRAYAAVWNAGALAGRLADAYQEVIRVSSRVLPEPDKRKRNPPAADAAIR